jgi:hypothetical protein
MRRALSGLLRVLLFVPATTVSGEIRRRGDFETSDTSQGKDAPDTGHQFVAEQMLKQFT